ncbi:MAG: hypothetical protein EOM80_03265 [Erysipelotrichia bacterium]|nr:hypothetical protein [Erysipelotrichia bacterium]
MKKLALIIAILIASAPMLLLANDGSARGEIKPAPWSGDWWSRKKGFMIKGWPGHSPSPFERYDAYVQSRTGKNPGTVAWEGNVRNAHYNPNAESWEGHCNGWSAAAILTAEPNRNRVRNGIEFKTADQKAILSEIYMNTYCNFYGNRNWGKPGDNRDDIYPDEFHRLLINYIASGKSAVVCDIESDRMVWNYPLYKFESTWTTGWFDDKKLKVTTTCYFVDDNVKPDFIGCKWFSVKYTYNLILDQNNAIVSGEWTGESRKNHPDFVWVPTKDAPNPANSNLENPCFDPRMVKEICEGPDNRDFRGGSEVRSPDAVVMEAGLNPADIF